MNSLLYLLHDPESRLNLHIYILFLASVHLAGILFDDFGNFWVFVVVVPDGFHIEWTGGRVVDVQFAVGGEVGDPDDVLLGEEWCILFFEIFRVFGTDLEGHDGSGISEYRVFDRWFPVFGFTSSDLGDVLVGHNEREVVLAGFG